MMEQQCSSRQNNYISYKLAVQLSSLSSDLLYENTYHYYGDAVKRQNNTSLYNGNEIGAIFNRCNKDKFDLRIRPVKKDSTHIIIPIDNMRALKARRPDIIFLSLTNSSHFAKYVTSKNDIYYSGYGIILNENRKPLIIFGKKQDSPKMTIKISPSVFTSDRMVEKFIAKNIVPTASMGFMSGDMFKCARLRGVGRILFDIEISSDIDSYIISRNTPESHLEIDAANEFIQSHNDAFIDYFKHEIFNGNE